MGLRKQIWRKMRTARRLRPRMGTRTRIGMEWEKGIGLGKRMKKKTRMAMGPRTNL